jgi:hypothetical protein
MESKRNETMLRHKVCSQGVSEEGIELDKGEGNLEGDFGGKGALGEVSTMGANEVGMESLLGSRDPAWSREGITEKQSRRISSNTQGQPKQRNKRKT